MKRIVKPHPYKIIIEEFKKADMRYYESVLSLSNGYMGMRGSFEEGSNAFGLRGTYIAGVWYPDRTRVGWWKNGYPDYFGKAVNALNLIDIDIYVNGARVLMSEEGLLSFCCELDMRQSVLKRSAVLAAPCGNITVEAQRFLSFDMKHVCALRYKVTAAEAVSLSLVPHIDFDVYNESSNYNERLMDAKGQSFHRGIGYIEAVTKNNEFGKETYGVGAAMSVTAALGEPDVKETLAPGCAELDMRFSLKAGQSAQIDKIVSVFTTRDGESPEQGALSTAEEAAALGYDALLERHVRKYTERMRGCDIELKGDERAQQGARYCIYQLASTFDGSDKRLNIGPKGMTGEKYGGAAYWDTDAFLVPFYLATHDQSVARDLLKFRYNTLEAAKANANKLGLSGALYPMVTFDGNECHNEWEITFEEIHRNGAVAYAIFNYATYTGDTEYLIKYGFPVLLEISRFWADRVSWSDSKSAYVILGVTGPNEYENNVNNNWYTNSIAKWCLDYTSFVAEEYKNELEAECTQQELDKFRRISAGMYLPCDGEQGVFLQQDGWLDKELVKAERLLPAERPLWQHWSWDRILRSCFIKQADVLQGLYFLYDAYDRETVRRNFEYYEQYTVHESSLSAGIHSVVASRAGLYDKAYELFTRAVRLDLDDLGNDASDGLHITAMSGAWLAIVQGFAGMRTAGGALEFQPYLPKQLTAYSFAVNYRGTFIRIEVSTRGIKATKLDGVGAKIQLYNKTYLLEEACECALRETERG